MRGWRSPAPGWTWTRRVAGTVIDAGGRRVGMVAVSDHPGEFAAAAGTSGIAYADLRRGIPAWLEAELGRVRATCDVLVAFPTGVST